MTSHSPTADDERVRVEATTDIGDDANRFSVAPGERIYAIGDVHGCYALLEQLLARVRADHEARPPALTRLILLGDVVDRGPESRTVIEQLMRFTRASPRFQVLLGNHEQIMASVLAGDSAALSAWLRIGGDATLRSWGVSQAVIERSRPAQLLDIARRRIGVDVALWLERLPTTAISGEVLFVHAGVKPGVPLAAQALRDLLWITSEFLESEEVRPFLVVHGHTIDADGPVVRANRIGLDTGAFRTGRLTAMGFEGSRRWVVGASALTSPTT